MNIHYVSGVRRFGSRDPYIAESGKGYNLSREQFMPDDVTTDGLGNIIDVPAMRRKDCFGRPERLLRDTYERRMPFGLAQQDGTRRTGQTRCDRCAVREACQKVVFERIESSPAISAAVEAFDNAASPDADKVRVGRMLGSQLFYRHRREWHAVLSAIIDHGGWDNVNEDRAKLAAQERAKEQAKAREAARKARRQRARDAALGKARPITADWLAELLAERDRRAEALKRLKAAQDRPAWLARMTDEGCDRVADVWQGRERLKRAGQRVTGKAIAEWMIAEGRGYGLPLASLTNRVNEYRKTIEGKLENDKHGSPVWAAWA